MPCEGLSFYHYKSLNMSKMTFLQGCDNLVS